MSELAQFLTEKNISKTRLARYIGISNYGLTKILKGETSRPHDHTILKMESFLSEFMGNNVQSGRDDQGIYFIIEDNKIKESINIDSDMLYFMNLYNQLPEHVQKNIREIMEAFIQKEKSGEENI
jgi:transcriptional regulator with XRE-family HTH domain